MLNTVDRCCVRCAKALSGKRRLYCSDVCRYWVQQVKNAKTSMFRVAQHLRMMRAGRAQRRGRIGCRFN